MMSDFSLYFLGSACFIGACYLMWVMFWGDDK